MDPLLLRLERINGFLKTGGVQADLYKPGRWARIQSTIS